MSGDEVAEFDSVYLELIERDGRRKVSFVDGVVSIGRHPESVLRLKDEGLSRRHCLVERCDDGWILRDLGSRNGTKVNGRRESEKLLAHGDRIKVGRTLLRFVDRGSKEARGRADDASVAECEPGTDVEIAGGLDVDLASVVGDRRRDSIAVLENVCADTSQRTGLNDISFFDARGREVHAGKRAEDETRGKAIGLFRGIVQAALRSRATDIHVEPRSENVSVRFRVDGQMVKITEIEPAAFARVLGITKILCEVDPSLKAAVQEGHFSAKVAVDRIDFRVSLTPVVNGQKLVIRVLDAAMVPSRLHDLGLVPWMFDKVRRVAIRDSGMLLVSGPTGSGKTTTLHSCLREIDVDTRNAITIEDPVEYQLDGATQIPVDHKQGHGFATILRSVLRQDPDVIFVGEIRDVETATVASQAAMTGHLVYSTVHAKDTIGAVFRLLDLGLEPYLVANALSLVMAQRLVRVLCKTCRRRIAPTSAQSLALGKLAEGVSRVHVPRGCAACLETGYHGRRAVFELLEFNESLRDILLDTPSIAAIRRSLRGGHFISLRQFGLQLVVDGETSFEEIERIAPED